MGKARKKKNNSRMPVSHGREGVRSVSSPLADSATDLEIQSGSLADIVDVDKKDEQTPGELTNNMSNPLSQVDGAKPEEANENTADEGTVEDENNPKETTAATDTSSIDSPSNEFTTATTITAESTGEDNLVDSKTTEGTAGPESTSIEEDECTGEATPAGVPTTDADVHQGETAATGGSPKEEGDEAVEDTVSTEVAISKGTSGGGGVEAGVSASAAETDSIKEAVSNEDTSASEAVVTGTEETAPTDFQGAAPNEKATNPDNAASGEEPDASGEEPDASGEEPDASGEEPDASGGEPDASGGATPVEKVAVTNEDAPIEDDPAVDSQVSEQEASVRKEALPNEGADAPEGIETREDALGGISIVEEESTSTAENHTATEHEPTKSDEPGTPSDGTPHITEHAGIEANLEEVDPEVPKSVVGSPTHEQVVVEPILEEVEPELSKLHETDCQQTISVTEVVPVLDEVTPDTNAEDEDDSNPANAEPTGGQAESTDDAGSNEEEVTGSDITAPTTAGSSVCGDSTASEATAATETEDTTTEDANADKAIIGGERVTVVEEGSSTEVGPEVEKSAIVEDSQVVDKTSAVKEIPVAGSAPASDEEQNAGKGTIEEPSEESRVEEADPIREPAVVEDTTTEHPITAENAPVANESPTREDTSPVLGTPAVESDTVPEAGASPAEPKASPSEGETPASEPQTPPLGEGIPATVEPEVSSPEPAPPTGESPIVELAASTTEPEVIRTEEAAPIAVPEAFTIEEVSRAEVEAPHPDLASSLPEEAPNAPPEAFTPQPEIPPAEVAMASAEADVAVEDGPSGESAREAAAGDPPASPTSRRRKLHWSPENGDETLLEHIIRPHRARRESDASVFTVKAGKSMPDTTKHHHRRRESGASGHSRVDRDSLRKKARTPEEEEERRKRKEAKEAMSPEEREERRKRKEARKSAKEPDQFSVGSHSGDKDGSDKSRHHHERNSFSKQPTRPKLLSVFHAESDFKVPILWINTGTTEIKGVRRSSHSSHPSSPKSPKPHRHHTDKEAHRSKREERKRETGEQDAQERELKEEKLPSLINEEANGSPQSGHHKHRREHRREHHRSSKHGKNRVTDGDSPITVFRKVMTRELKNFFLQ